MSSTSHKQIFCSIAVALACFALVANCAPANGKTNSKGGNNNGSKSPFAALRQQQQQQEAAASKTSAAAVNAPVFSARPPVAPNNNNIVQQQQQQEAEVDADSQPQAQVQLPTTQQQQQEVDPSAAAQDSSPAVIAPSNNNNAAAAAEEAEPRPEPYAFNYAWESGDANTAGSSSRAEQQDAAGVVTGFYTLRGEDGRDRRVDYTADASGFRAIVSTNELGTEAKDPADVQMRASAPTDGQLRAAAAATELARQRAVLIPQPVLPIQQPNLVAIQVPLNQQLGNLGLASGNQATIALAPQQARKPAASNQRQNPAREQFASGSKTSPVLAASSSQQQQISQQLQEPFEQIRQSELKARSVRSVPFYLIKN